MKTLSLTFAVATMALAAPPALANPTNVSWSSVGAGCVPDSATVAGGLASINAAFGTVTFASGQSGHIKLICPVSSLSVTAAAATGLSMTYYNDNGFAGNVSHCTVRADLLRTNLNNVEHGADIAEAASPNFATTGRSLSGASLSESLDLDTSYYWVDVDMFRDSATATCNPTLVGVYLAPANIIH